MLWEDMGKSTMDDDDDDCGGFAVFVHWCSHLLSTLACFPMLVAGKCYYYQHLGEQSNHSVHPNDWRGSSGLM
jgi:hypothetical protein